MKKFGRCCGWSSTQGTYNKSRVVMAEEQAGRIMSDYCEEPTGDSGVKHVKLDPISENISAMKSFSLESGGASSLLQNSIASSSSEYFSTRIERLTQMRTAYATASEYEIEASRDHWSTVVPRKISEEGEEEDGAGDWRLATEEIFEKLRKQFPRFFYKQLSYVRGNLFEEEGAYWEVGEKIAEGGQGEIYEAKTYEFGMNYEGAWVMKVFKEGTSLQDLQRQWPSGLLQKFCGPGTFNSGLHFGLLLKNGRFAFVMRRYWGDLRKLIDLRMQHNRNTGMPFRRDEAKTIMFCIAKGIQHLHRMKVLHRDIKASNVLIRSNGRYHNAMDPVKNYISRYFGDVPSLNFCFDVADFECSVGVVGTEFWRAPEILEVVKNRIRPIPPRIFTQKSDTYSYAMTCCEILTGRIPFEDLQHTAYDVVIGGARPVLPSDTETWIKELLGRCWHVVPSQRPTFNEIVDIFNQNYPLV